MSGTYDGEPLDMSWQNGPWARDGETVGVVDSEGGGESVTVIGPGTSPREAVLESIDEIRQRLLDGGVGKEIASEYDIHPAVLSNIVTNEIEGVDAEVPPVTFERGSNGYVIKEDNVDQQIEKSNQNPDLKIDNSEIEKIRRRALDGESAKDIAEDYDASRWSIQNRIRGDIGDDSLSDIPPLVWDSSKREYVNPNGGVETTQSNAPQVEMGDAATDGAEEVSEPTTDIEPSPVYGSPNAQESGDKSPLKGVALFALGVLAGIVLRGGS